MQLGISLYTGVDKDLTLHAIDKAEEEGMHIAFSSLQIPEEQNDSIIEKFREIQNYAKKHGIQIFTDISKDTLVKLKINDIHELKDIGIEYIRLDAGFSDKEIIDLSKDFHIVVNASVVDYAFMNMLDKCCKKHVFACHNYYPEPYTGLSLSYIREKNDVFHFYGIKTIGFIPGNNHLRGPISEGLPTIEEHRIKKEQLIRNALEMNEAGCDIVLIGDIDVKDTDWDKLGKLNSGYVEIPLCTNTSIDDYLSLTHHDRVDASEWMYRSIESRGLKKHALEPENTVNRKIGDVFINNGLFGRYAGEMGIAKKEMPIDERVNIVGHIDENYLDILNLVKEETGIRLKKV